MPYTKKRMPRRKIGMTYRVMAAIAQPIVRLLFEREWEGERHIPADGGFIAAVNHNSYIDPLAYGYFQYAMGRPPRFFAKQGLFTGAFGRLMHAMKHIPVARGGAGALAALEAAATAVRAGRAWSSIRKARSPVIRRCGRCGAGPESHGSRWKPAVR